MTSGKAEMRTGLAALDPGIPLYSPPLDRLVRWGRAHLLGEGEKVALKEVDAECRTATAGTLDVAGLQAGLERLSTEADAALERLQGSAIFGPDSLSVDRLRDATQTLDNVVFLSEALEYLPDTDQFPEAFLGAAEHLVADVTLNRAPPPLRLVPLNRWRQAALAGIPEPSHYLFPWYAALADLPDDILERLADAWDEIMESSGAVEGVEGGDLNIALLELRKDLALLAYLGEAARLSGELGRAIAESPALQLFSAARRETPKRRLPPIVEQLGLARVAVTYLSRPPLSEADRWERLLQAAVCGPSEEGARISLLSEAIDRAGDLSTPDRRSLATVAAWRRGDVGVETVVSGVFDEWERVLLAATDEFRAGESTGPVLGFGEALERLRSLPTVEDAAKIVAWYVLGCAALSHSTAHGRLSLYATGISEDGPEDLLLQERDWEIRLRVGQKGLEATAAERRPGDEPFSRLVLALGQGERMELCRWSADECRGGTAKSIDAKRLGGTIDLEGLRSLATRGEFVIGVVR